MKCAGNQRWQLLYWHNPAPRSSTPPPYPSPLCSGLYAAHIRRPSRHIEERESELECVFSLVWSKGIRHTSARAPLYIMYADLRLCNLLPYIFIFCRILFPPSIIFIYLFDFFFRVIQTQYYSFATLSSPMRLVLHSHPRWPWFDTRPRAPYQS